MINPWLSIPLEDYEGHMSLPEIGQASALASELARLLGERRPASLALLGCSGGNGLEHVDAAVTSRVVALDINPAFLEATMARFGRVFEVLEPVLCDLTTVREAPFRPVELAFAGLLLEYVPVRSTLQLIRSALLPGGALGCVLQEESATLAHVTPSPYSSLGALAGCMTLRSPAEVTHEAAAVGLDLLETRTLVMPNGKVLASLLFEAS